jgi:hypothetical protein
MIYLTTSAQSKSLDNIIATLNNAEVIKNCAEFKRDISGKILQLKSMQNIDASKFNDLRIAYSDVYEKYDAFLKSVKSDLSNIENLRTLIKDPELTAQNYAASYQSVRDSYENNFLQKFNNLQYSETKGIPFLVLLKFGINAFKVIANSIKNHKIDKEGAINLILPAINEKIFNKLKLNTWSEFKLAEPSGYTAEEAIVIPQRTLNSLQGTICFFQEDKSGSEDKPVYFISSEGRKDLRVITDNADEKLLVTDEYFSTAKRFETGSKIRLEVNNSGFTYILALNTDGIALLHPFENIVISKDAATKDITITGDETPATGIVRIPSPAANGTPRFFTIVKNATGIETGAEEMAILLSKSELELEELVQKLNNVNGNLSERITRVFGEQKILTGEAHLSNEDNYIRFEANNADKNVLPLVFKILKK